MVQIVDEKNINKNKSALLLLMGFAIGLCIMSKVHGVFLWGGFGLYVLLYNRKMLAQPALYGALLLTAIIVSPILIWNIQNNFITYSFHENRVGFFNKHLDWDSFLQQVLGSIAYSNPINFILYMLGIVGIIKHKNFINKSYLRLFLLLGLPLIIVLIVMSLFNETLPHWSGPAYISILLISAVYFSKKNSDAIKIPRGIAAANYLLLFVAVAGIIVIRYLPIQLGNKKEKILGDGDVTLDMVGWKNFADEFYSLRNADIKNGLMKKKFIYHF